MATDLTVLGGRLSILIEMTAGKTRDLGTPSAILSMAKDLALAFGTGVGKADQIWYDRRVIAGGADDPLNLVATLLSPITGIAVNFDLVRAFAVFNRSDETLTHSGGSHTATDAGIVVLDTGSTFQGPCKTLAKGQVLEAGGVWAAWNPLAAGWNVADDANDIFQVDNEDGSDEACYDIVVIGEST